MGKTTYISLYSSTKFECKEITNHSNSGKCVKTSETLHEQIQKEDKDNLQTEI